MTLFEALPNRKKTRSYKWDMVEKLYGSQDIQPMWVADMDLPIASPIKQALHERVDHAIFGYTFTDAHVNQVIQQWLSTQHDWEIDTDWIIYSPGVIPTLHMAVLTQTNPGDKVLIQTPVYPPFYDVINNHDRKLVTNSLIEQDGYYTMDFEDLEEKFRQGVKAFILCNPHNPVGRVWTEKELKKIALLCDQYDVLLFSDEIHADLTFDEAKHIPISSLNESTNNRTITCMSPTKTFNLAGLQISYAIVPNKAMRRAMTQMLHKYGLHMLNTLGITALEAAYHEGKEWLNELLDLLTVNRDFVIDAFKDCKQIKATKPEGTYLIWLDCRGMNRTHNEIKRFMQEEAKVGLNDGMTFGTEGKGFMRINIASPTSYVQQGVNKILEALDNSEERRLKT
ncbi:cystathionine beta-lyase [Natronobacillus azotifigens]|uniref:cysteine-S-conjugate beta-lyase n=1 Tax=Natronobacillus azotifigens TaxID=472978 RepID=A0A9J6RFR4_9BACI|nr:MalY/PatB family protein [Natronobacillus azotifigens]MCZ0704252.1 pyridoxal phosphate-dependent aminotransferase [Natronobacillus azotifigens]